MARIARVVAENIPHHVIQRGNRNQPVFFSDDDKSQYLHILRAQLAVNQVHIWAWCLMDTHVHFVAVPSHRETFSRAFAETHRLYSRMINFREGWRGYLFQGRFSSFPMDDRYLHAAVRYVENNPVKAKMAENAENYEWSSAKTRILGRKDAILSKCFLDEEIVDWRGFLRSGTDNDNHVFDKHAKTGRPLGDAPFVNRLETMLKRSLSKMKPGPKISDRVLELN